jgi:hypothetical protein
MQLYEVVPLENSQNLPDTLLGFLKKMYKFILIEALQEQNYFERKICKSCQDWCQPNFPIVSCFTCLQAFHLICAGITKALPKGFAWECATCQKTQLEKSKKLDAVQDLLEEDPDSDEDPSSATTELEDIQDIVKKQNEQYLLSESQVLVLNGELFLANQDKCL